jgi:hypothetical protein
MELPPSTRTRLSFTSLTMGLMMRGYRLSFGIKSEWSMQLEVMGTLDRFRYSGVVGLDYHDLSGCEFLLHP